MKKYLSIILGIILTACLVACGSSNKGTLNDNEQKVAVVYFSGTGNTREVAQRNDFAYRQLRNTQFVYFSCAN